MQGEAAGAIGLNGAAQGLFKGSEHLFGQFFAWAFDKWSPQEKAGIPSSLRELKVGCFVKRDEARGNAQQFMGWEECGRLGVRKPCAGAPGDFRGGFGAGTHGKSGIERAVSEVAFHFRPCLAGVVTDQVSKIVWFEYVSQFVGQSDFEVGLGRSLRARFFFSAGQTCEDAVRKFQEVGFACPIFTDDDVQVTSKLKVGLRERGEVLDVQLSDHACVMLTE